MHGCTIWLTGLSGAGKTTIALELQKELNKREIRNYLLDGDVVRSGLCIDLEFNKEDRTENIRRLREVALILVDSGCVSIVAAISPISRDRDKCRERHEEKDIPFFEVYISTPIEICESRDPKGLYKKVRDGKIPLFTGVTSPYEIPKKPDVIITPKDSPQDAAIKILKKVMG